MNEENNDKVIRDAQYRKGLSIAYFNSVNAAIELAKVMFPDLEGVDAKKFIAEWRDWFLEEHKNYYATVIAKVGTNYSAEEAIKKLKATKNMEALQIVWINFSEDERHDPEIAKCAKALKESYEKSH